MQLTTEITDAYGENRKKNFNCSGVHAAAPVIVYAALVMIPTR